MKTIVISAVNLKVGGTLTILRECLGYLSTLAAGGDYRIIALVHRRDLALFPNIDYIEMQWAKKTWVNRLWCEYIAMKRLSRRLSPVYLWLSLHDTTPNVFAKRRAVYCHNSFPFYSWKISELYFAPKIALLAIFSKEIYRKNIHTNNYLIMQQQWMKREFVEMFGLSQEKIIVAPPYIADKDIVMTEQNLPEKKCYSFIYPASPDSHKNFECIVRAVELLHKKSITDGFEVCITVKGNENRYAKWLYKNWGECISNLRFIGFLNRKTLYDYYAQCDCLIFPSKIESWGLPITEFAAFGKPMLLADLPYAHETANGCSAVSFFDPNDPGELARKMESLIADDKSFLEDVTKETLMEPVVWSWKELFDILLK